jgi:hypothetical protein
MDLGFDDLMLEFETIFEAAINESHLPARRILLAEASMTLSRARDIWQDELKRLRTTAESLRDARVGLTTSEEDPDRTRPVLRQPFTALPPTRRRTYPYNDKDAMGSTSGRHA